MEEKSDDQRNPQWRPVTRPPKAPNTPDICSIASSNVSPASLRLELAGPLRSILAPSCSKCQTASIVPGNVLQFKDALRDGPRTCPITPIPIRFAICHPVCEETGRWGAYINDPLNISSKMFSCSIRLQVTPHEVPRGNVSKTSCTTHRTRSPTSRRDRDGTAVPPIKPPGQA